MKAVKLAEAGDLQADNDGLATLPPEYRNLSVTGEVYLTREANYTSVYFMDGQDEFDSISWGYVYQSNGNPSDPEECGSWREIRPHYQNWYYCETH
jgi:hypothetical protein